MDKVPKLGNLITDESHRDAVHIAVAPVTAGSDLYPGDRIGFVGNAYTVDTEAVPIIGIVDPFLNNVVLAGERFYMFLLPNTITSLRHEWTHPAFEKEDELSSMEPTFFKLKGAIAEEKWVADYAERIGTTYSELMEAAASYQATGEYFCKGGDFEGEYITEEFWDKYEIITRKPIDERGSFLTCSC
jgi:hypothetical protein